MKKFILLFAIILLIAAFGVFSFLPNYLSKSSNAEEVIIAVPNGASLSRVANELYEKGVIRSKLWFRYSGKDIARNIKPGNYKIGPGLDIEEIYKIIQKGEHENQIKVTFPEGFILYQFAQRIEEAGLGTAEEFIKASKDYFTLKGYDLDTSNMYFSMEGYLFPDTYYFTEKQDIDEIVSKLASAMDGVLTEEYRAKAEELGMSIHEVLTIASLIEREAYNDAERKTVSGVIHNRLKNHMLLQIDASVIYGLGEGKDHMTRLLYADLEKDNPYNTYKNIGLPPGPIASPGRKSIEAALYPEDHDYLYYVLGENGHVFSKTYDEHLVNVGKYR
ncbi:endolytic transglycosylase MltG [Tissierella creatinini]|nr:endolytic transglycosylase MltG [Tissierella creatinini]TJX62795.1 endolytic transglycosylase MltG [Soehngenia saccharolytica]